MFDWGVQVGNSEHQLKFNIMAKNKVFRIKRKVTTNLINAAYDVQRTSVLIQ